MKEAKKKSKELRISLSSLYKKGGVIEKNMLFYIIE